MGSHGTNSAASLDVEFRIRRVRWNAPEQSQTIVMTSSGRFPRQSQVAWTPADQARWVNG